MSQMSARRAYIAAALVLIAIVAIVNLTLPTSTAFPESDAWAHTSALREWISDLGDPGHSHLPVATPSARFIPPYLPIAALSAVVGWSSLAAFALSAIAVTALLTFVLYRFFRMLVPDEPWLPLTGLGALLFAWGLASPWSGMFELRSLVAVAGYPSAWSFVLGLAMVLAAVRAAEKRSPWWLGLTAVLSAGVLLSHPITAAFVYSLAAVVAIDRNWRSFALPGLAAAGGIALAFAWPFFSLWEVIREPLILGEDGRLIAQFYNPLRVIAMVAPALVGLYALTRLEGRRRAALTLGAAAMAALWLANIVIAVPVGDRFLIFSVFYLQVALALWLTPLLRSLEGTSAAASAARITIAALIAGHALITIADVGGRRINLTDISLLGNRGDIDIVAQMEDVAAAVPDDSIVMADPTTRWMLPAFAGKVVAVGRDYFGVDDAEDRLADAGVFFSGAATAQQRRELLESYGADFILFAPEEAGPELTAQLERMGEVAVTTRFFVLVAALSR